MVALTLASLYHHALEKGVRGWEPLQAVPCCCSPCAPYGQLCYGGSKRPPESEEPRLRKGFASPAMLR